MESWALNKSSVYLNLTALIDDWHLLAMETTVVALWIFL